MLDTVKNFAQASLDAGIAIGDVTFSCTGKGSLFPEPGVGAETAFNGVIWNSTDFPDPADDPYHEIVRCTARTVDAFVVTRAQEGTVAAAHNTPAKVYKFMQGITAKMIQDIGSDMGQANPAVAVVVFGTIGVTQTAAITRVDQLATYTKTAHGFAVGDWVQIQSAAQAEYNGWHQILDVPTVDTFTYLVSGTPATPSTGTSTVNVHVCSEFSTGMGLIAGISHTAAGVIVVTFVTTQATANYPVIFTPGVNAVITSMMVSVLSRTTAGFTVQIGDMGAGSTYTGRAANGNTMVLYGVV